MYREKIKILFPVSKIVTKSQMLENENEIFSEKKIVQKDSKTNEKIDSTNGLVPEDEFDEQLISVEFQKEHNELLNQIKLILEKIEQTIKNYNIEEKNAMEQVFEKVSSFAFKIAEKVVHKKILIDKSIIKETLAHAIESSFEKKKLTIILNPNDVQTIQSCAEDFGMDEKTMTNTWKLESNKDISPGGCLIETPNEEIDARIESQLKALEDTILNNIGYE
jgi:flagellar assembly protein FliH